MDRLDQLERTGTTPHDGNLSTWKEPSPRWRWEPCCLADRRSEASPQSTRSGRPGWPCGWRLASPPAPGRCPQTPGPCTIHRKVGSAPAKERKSNAIVPTITVKDFYFFFLRGTQSDTNITRMFRQGPVQVSMCAHMNYCRII
jgi:hypothetical protein